MGTWDHTETQPEGILKDDGDGNVTGVDHHQHARPAAYGRSADNRDVYRAAHFVVPHQMVSHLEGISTCPRPPL